MSLRNVSCFLFALLICPAMGFAAATGTIAGAVHDPSGAPVAGAKVTAISAGTGLTREAVTDAGGEYVIPLLPAGEYNVSTAANGFERIEQKGIVVTADQTASVPVTLKIGNSSQSVTVDAGSQMVETRSSALTQVINEKEIVELPLNGRNPAALVLLTPGTADLTAGNARGGTNAVQSTTYPGAQAISSGGSRYDGVNYRLDGGSAEDVYSNISNPFPNPDAVQEFSVVTNSFSAEYGHAAGAIVNVVTKSGTNQIHGDAFEFLRNEDFNARNFFAATPDLLKRNQFGGSVGGPIKKNKLFYFGNYQATISHDITEGNSAVVPTAAERAGNFSAISTPLVNPTTGVPYPGNQIPASQISPASLKILQSVPLPSTPGGLTYYGLPVDNTENQFLTRLDYDLNDKNHIYGRYFYTKYVQNPESVPTDILATAGGNNFFDQTAAIGHTYTVSANMTNSFLFSYTRDNDLVTIASPFAWPSLGVQIAVTPQAPEVSLSVAGWFSVATNHFTDNNRHVFDFSDSLHWVKGKHELAFGGQIIRANDDMNNIHRQNGVFSFSTNSLTGNPMSDFLTGQAYSFTQGGGEYFNRTGNLGSLFVEDKYRLTPSLLLTLGLRWDPFVPYSDSEGRTECFIPGEQSQRFPNSPNGYVYAGDTGCPAGGFSSSWKEFGPRAGLVYNPGGNSRTTIRAGWGMFYQPPSVLFFANMADSAPFSPNYTLYKVPFMNPYQGTTNPFPAQFGPQTPSTNFNFALPLSLGVAYQPNWTPARIMNWNLTVERQVMKDVLVRVAYVASAGRFLSYNTDPNAPLPSATATAANEQARRPYQQFVQITEDMSGGNSEYNALQVTVEKRFSHGFNLTANYTWSKSIDTSSYSSDLNAITIINPYNVNAYRGLSDFNVPQIFVLNYLWQLPSPRGGLARKLFGGWSTTAIWTWQSGFPLDISSGGDYSYSLPELANDQARQVSTPSYTSGPDGARIAKWFTTSSFATPLPNTFGNVGRNTLVGPDTFNVDFSAHKDFTIRERFRLQYRAEFFDFFNHPLFDNPNTTVTQSTFGQITTARNPRIAQMAFKFVF